MNEIILNKPPEDVDGESIGNLYNDGSTFDLHNKHLRIRYSDPALLPTLETTHDAAIRQNGLAIEALPNRIGDTQIMNGSVYRWDGSQWCPLSGLR